MRKLITNYKNIRLRGTRRCPFCGYFGGGWPDSGECPRCGEVS